MTDTEIVDLLERIWRANQERLIGGEYRQSLGTAAHYATLEEMRGDSFRLFAARVLIDPATHPERFGPRSIPPQL